MIMLSHTNRSFMDKLSFFMITQKQKVFKDVYFSVASSRVTMSINREYPDFKINLLVEGSKVLFGTRPAKQCFFINCFCSAHNGFNKVKNHNLFFLQDYTSEPDQINTLEAVLDEVKDYAAPLRNETRLYKDLIFYI